MVAGDQALLLAAHIAQVSCRRRMAEILFKTVMRLSRLHCGTYRLMLGILHAATLERVWSVSEAKVRRRRRDRTWCRVAEQRWWR